MELLKDITQAYRVIFALLVMLVPTIGNASTAGTIDFIQGDVHVERQNQRVAAKKGMSIEELDVIKTGDTSRVRIIFKDQSSMQLGSNAETKIQHYKVSETGILDSFIKLVEGRVRFIVNKIRKAESKYQIKMHAVLIGVRGTDILAEARVSADHIALVEGRIALSDPQENQLILNKGQYMQTQKLALPQQSSAIPEQWLNAFMKDVGSSQLSNKKKKSSSETDNSPLTDAIREKTSNTLGSPTIIPR